MVAFKAGHAPGMVIGSLGLGLGILSAIFPVVSGAALIGALAVAALAASIVFAKDAVVAHKEAKAIESGMPSDIKEDSVNTSKPEKRPLVDPIHGI